MKKSVIGIGLAGVLIAVCSFIPVPEALGRSGILALGIFVAAVVMWIAESLPMGVCGLGMAMLMVLFDIYSISDAYRCFAGTSFFFVFATYAINASLAETSIPDRICSFFIRITKSNSKWFVFGMMLAATILSAIMSNMATCALLATLALKILRMNGNPKPGTSKLGKSLMIGIPFAAGVGGFATPAGTPANIIAIDLLQEQFGITVTFLDWMLMGIPVALIAVSICAFSVTRVFPPEPLTEETIAYADKLRDMQGKMSVKEKKVLAVIGTEIVLWILSTWIPVLNTALVAILAMAVMFMPGVEVLDWKTYHKYANYDSLFMIGSITALVGGLNASGATDWLVSVLLPRINLTSAFVIFLITSLFVAVCHMVIPSGSAVLTLCAVPVLGIAEASGVDPQILMMIAAFWSGTVFFLPFDGVPLLTYSYGYYKMTDMPKAGFLPYIILIPAISIVIPFIL